jgi:F-box domain
MSTVNVSCIENSICNTTTTLSPKRLENLPDDALMSIILYLNGYDIVNMLSTCKGLRQWEKDKCQQSVTSPSTTTTVKIWSLLLQEHDHSRITSNSSISTSNNEILAKERYLLYTVGRSLRSVRWLLTIPDTALVKRRQDGRVQRISGKTNTNTPSSREGHLSCTMYNDEVWIVTGGFTDDMTVYIKEIPSIGSVSHDNSSYAKNDDDDDSYDEENIHTPSWITVTPSMIDGSAQRRQQTTSIHPQFMNAIENDDTISFEWVYGGTLTTIDVNRAVRFGGFRSGGYSMESSQVAVLEVHRTKREVQSDNEVGLTAKSRHQQQQQQQQYDYTASWIVQPCSVALTPLGGIGHMGKEDESTTQDKDKPKNFNTARPQPFLSSTDPRIRSWWHPIASRAYHSSTLLFNRYLLVLGGMKSNRSTFFPIVLDINTWTWYYEGLIASSEKESPSPRFGHSIIPDFAYFSKNNKSSRTSMAAANSTRQQHGRLLLFGGGNGSDLLRSGHDNTEVWELNLHLDRCRRLTSTDNDNDLADLNISDSLPWTWSLIHEDPNHPREPTEDGKANVKQDQATTQPSLSPSERLMLGRCHHGIKVTSQSAMFLFGSGDPSTNGLLGYDLESDTFLRPKIIGPLPLPRFTCACSYVAHLGFVLVHGGYSTQITEMTQDVCILDVAPTLDYMYSNSPSSSGCKSHRRKYASKMFVINDTSTRNKSSSSYPLSPTHYHGPVTDEHVLNVSESRARLDHANAILEYFLTVSDVQGQFFNPNNDINHDGEDVGIVQNENYSNQEIANAFSQRQQEPIDEQIISSALTSIGFGQQQLQQGVNEQLAREELIRLLLEATMGDISNNIGSHDTNNLAE